MNNSLNSSVISDNQAESTLIGSVIAHPEFLYHLDFVQANQFYNTENGCIWWACQELAKNGVENIDAINLSNAINSNLAVRKKTEEYGIVDIQNFITMSQYTARDTIEEVKMLAKTVTTLAYKRDMSKIADQIQRNCFNDSMDLNQLNNFVNGTLDKINEKYIISDEIRMYGDKVDDLWNEIVERRTETGLAGLPFKFPSLNEYVTLEKTELCVVAARMKMGKSALLLNQATYSLRSGVPTLYCDSEMSDRLFHERMLANIAGVPVKAIKTGNYTPEQGEKLAKANEWIKKQPFVHIYLPEHTNEELYAIHKMLKNKMGLELSIFDYIKSNVISTSDNYNVLGAKVDYLKNKICGELDLAMFSAVQLNRAGEIADSDKISRHLSTLLIWEPKLNDEIRDNPEYGNFKLRVELNRLGEQMLEDEAINMEFNGNLMRVTEAKQNDKTFNSPFNTPEAKDD